MNIYFEIAGIDRTEDVSIDWSIEQVLTSQEDSCSFMVVAGDKPAAGEEVIVYDDTDKLFAGIVDEVKETAKGNGITFYDCSARDYSYLINRRLVVESYENLSADNLFKDIVSKYAPGFTANHVETGAPVIEAISFDYKSPSDCIKDICDYVGWEWYVDYDRDLYFFNPAELNQPAPIIINNMASFRKLKHSVDVQALRNRIYVRGGTYLSDFVTYEYKADGKQRAWVLPYKPHELTVSAGGGTLITPGVENEDDEAAEIWIVNSKEKTVRLAAAQPDISEGTTVSFTFKYDIDVITMVDEIESQIAIAAVQGGDGVYEYLITDESLSTIEAAEAAGNAELRQYANPKVKGSFETETTGWEPGQILQIDLPDQGITNSFVIQKVGISPIKENLCTWKVEYGGRLIGIADFLKALVSSQQNKATADTKILHKYIYGSQSAGVFDELEMTRRKLPYICGDVDAISGLVVVSNAEALSVQTDWYFIMPNFPAKI
jgi:hypothetical protein